MSDKYDIILEKVTAHIKTTLRKPIEITPDSMLLDLGVDSMGIITMLLMLEREVGLDFDRMIGTTPPKRLGDLVSLAAKAIAETQAQTPQKAAAVG